MRYCHEDRCMHRDVKALCKTSDVQIPSLIGQCKLALSGSLLEDILDKSFTGLVRATNERTTGTVEEAHVESALSPELEGLRGDVFFDLHVTFRGSHVLAECYDVYVNLA